MSHTHNHINGLKCEDCGESHGPLVMHSRCHPDMPTWTTIDGDLLKIECALCDTVICYFVVADGPFKHPPVPNELDSST